MPADGQPAASAPRGAATANGTVKRADPGAASLGASAFRTEKPSRPVEPRRETPQRARSAAATASRPAAAAAAPARTRKPVVFEGALSVASRPPGARVFLDRRPVGTTPMSLSQVSAGSHVVRLELAGYLPWSGAIQVVAGEQNRVTASLEPRAARSR
jgi:hypothetical protein